ncbi:hypothetical protein EU805_16875 [Salipiger sp. IMCC34102]|uniref:hypothetical protein n=1 Tax=Salipiger sp. IMCC34102 TaxID=2510647 RepID=UPI00101B7CC7|nr:hypothetical protein [Salipiger sp. IMCC34102]RYH00726.1 hypothetical protein EU805_16875 [Salipiger sp. IMCC34102]
MTTPGGSRAASRSEDVKLRLSPKERAQLDAAQKRAGARSRAAYIMSLVARPVDHPEDALAIQIGELNAWIYRLARNDPATALSSRQRSALLADLRRAVDRLCGWDAD